MNTWQDKDLLRFRKQETPWQINTSGGSLRFARVLRAGSLPATAAAYFWDVVILSDTCADTDININGRFDTARPVYPLIANASAPLAMSFSVGDIIVARISSAPSPNSTFETLSGDYDVAPMPAKAVIMFNVAGNGQYGYFQGMYDLGFGGIIVN